MCRVVFGEGNGTPLQYSCLENPIDGGAWKAAVHGVAEGRTRLSDFTFTFPFHALEGNGNPLQCSCLENPRDGGAWWAAVYGVAQGQTRLKWLSSNRVVLNLNYSVDQACFFSCLKQLIFFYPMFWNSGVSTLSYLSTQEKLIF